MLPKDTQFLGLKRSVKFLHDALRHPKIWKERIPSQDVIQHSEPHERSANTPKFEDRSEEETLNQERCVRRDAREMTKGILKLNFGCLVCTNVICNETRGKKVCCRFPRLYAHAEQERTDLDGIGKRSSIQNPNHGYFSQWRSASK